jgi:general secretion pathway protein D
LCQKAVVCLAAVAAILAADEPTAATLYKEGRQAERAGDVVRAYLLYSEAAAREPGNPKYASHTQALRTQAALKAKPMPKPATEAEKAPTPAAPALSDRDSSVSLAITDEDLADLKRMKPPPELHPTAGRKTLDLRGTARSVMEQTARAFGLETVFDGDYQPGPTVRLQLDDVDYRDALHGAEAATGSFVFPLGERLLMVVKDTPQKRTENEPTMAVTVPIPEAVTVQDAQELARGVQQTMDILKLAVDPNRRLVLIKDRVSKARPAQVLFEQLARKRAEVMIEVELLEVDRTNVLSYGLLLPNQFPLTYFGGGLPSTAVSLARAFFGHVTVGLGIANAQIFATMNKSYSKNLIDTQVLSVDGSPATFHVGSKYPIQTGGFLGSQQTSGLGVASSFNYEDLGLMLKITPHVHGMEEVGLDVEAEFKVLAGASLNGVPIVNSRKLQSKVCVHDGEWAVVGGLMSTSQARTITGIPGLSTLPKIGPVLRKNDRDDEDTEVLVVVRPVLVTLPPDQSAERTLWVGSEARLAIPL